MTTDSPPPGSESEPPSVPDEVWDKFLADSEREIRATAPKEPSARARIVARRLREEAEQEAAETGRRPGRRRFGRAPRYTPRNTAWRTGHTEAGERAQARGERIRTALALLAAVLLVLVLLSPHHAWSLVTGNGWNKAPGPAPTTLPPETARPSTAPPAVPQRQQATILRPFGGSPAEEWGDGAAAIVPPPAKAYGSASKAQVAAALATAKAFLVAADLDPHVLRGARPAAALALLDPAGGNRTAAERMLAHPTARAEPTVLFTRFAPDVTPVGTVVKVRGEMTLHKGRFGGVAISIDYTFVYPVRRTSDTRAWPEIARTVVRRTMTLELPDPARYRHTPGTLDATAWDSDEANSECGVHDGFLHPEFDGVPASTPSPAPTGSPSGSATGSPTGAPTVRATPSGAAVDPYDRSKALGAVNSGPCHPVTRT